jgi:hypothetical protein
MLLVGVDVEEVRQHGRRAAWTLVASRQGRFHDAGERHRFEHGLTDGLGSNWRIRMSWVRRITVLCRNVVRVPGLWCEGRGWNKVSEK